MNEGQGFAALDSKEDSHASAVPSLSNRTFDLTAPAPILIPFAPNAAPTAAAPAAASSAPSTTQARPKLKPKIGLKVFWLSPTTAGENEKAEIVSKTGKGRGTKWEIQWPNELNLSNRMVAASQLSMQRPDTGIFLYIVVHSMVRCCTWCATSAAVAPSGTYVV